MAIIFLDQYYNDYDNHSEKYLGRYIITQSGPSPISLADVKSYMMLQNSAFDSRLQLFIDAAVALFQKETGIFLTNTKVSAYFYGFHNYKPNPYPLGTRYDLTLYRGNINTIEKIVYNFPPDLYAALQSHGMIFSDITEQIVFPLNKMIFAKERCNYRITPQFEFSPLYVQAGLQFQYLPSYPDALRVDFIAGFGATADDVPLDIKMALYQAIASMYSNSGDCDCSGSSGNSGIGLPGLFANAAKNYTCNSFYCLI